MYIQKNMDVHLPFPLKIYRLMNLWIIQFLF